ncbi:MAG: GspE/PulE family protein [Clostridia bacterium]
MLFNQQRAIIIASKKYLRKSVLRETLNQAEQTNQPLLTLLKARALLTDMQILNVEAQFYNLACVDLEMLTIDQDLFNSVSYLFLKRFSIVPVKKLASGSVLYAIGDVVDGYALSQLMLFSIAPPEFILVLKSQIDKYLESQIATKTTTIALQDLEQQRKSENKGQDDQEEVNDLVVNAPAVRLVESIIKEALPLRASDIHLEPFETFVRVRYRIDGELIERARFDIDSYPAINARIKIMSGINIAERRIPQDGRFNLSANGTEWDFRVSTMPTVFGEKFVLRILDKSSFMFTSRELLNFTEKENELVTAMISRPYGIVLTVGPTGCGKSTTVYSFLKEINKPNVNIITVEDPIEYMLPGINQVQVNPKADLTFGTALRSILRQDPNVIMVGEMRDEETAQIAVRAAITGHLVFSTLHTNDAPSSAIRLSDMGIEPYLLADALVGVISQRLVKKLCPVCRKKVKSNQRETEILKLDEPTTIYRPDGCQFCNNTGYRGRMAIHEIMYASERVKSAIADKLPLEELRGICKSEGLINLWDSCKEQVLRGNTSIQELMSLTVE